MKFLAIPAALLLVAGCASEPAIQEGPDAEVTYDGLHRIDNSAFEYAYIDPDADWARYDKILPGGAEFRFRAVKKTSGTTLSRTTTSEFYVDEKNRARLEEEVSKVFAEELGQSERFSVTEGPGPDVLIVRGGLTDVVSRVPPEYAGRSEVFLTSVGEATLVLEIVDSMSGEVLFRAADRRAADRMGGGMTPVRSTPPTNWSEVRRLARRWASRLREGLDSLPSS
jgi:hypothetical protein